ncbi:MAG: hypothetical protein EBZ07_06955, partial [Verrucomicrobia bacterium]|nr:hypothetical protein [Verrucomicrobiota bacterium]
LKELVAGGVDFILGGGVACVLHGVERVTMDVDVAIHMDSANWDRLIGVMNKMGLLPRAPVRPETLIDPKVRQAMVEEKQALVFTFVHPDDPSLQLDVFLRPELSYESFKSHAQWMELGDIKLKILSPAKLLELKKGIRPQRSKDLLDITVLEAKIKKA